jgi:U3 small nucleolar ribonucleoprotein protein IMP4
LFPPQDPINSRPCNRVITFRNEDDIIDVRHHVYVRVRNSVELAEVGPRICMRLFQIKAGSLENKEGDVEWALNQYTRTAGKKRAL